MKLIDLHKQWMGTGKLPNKGLCYSLPKRYKNKLELFNDRFNRDDYWAYELEGYIWEDRVFAYTPLRQTIVLLICCMEGEY